MSEVKDYGEPIYIHWGDGRIRDRNDQSQHMGNNDDSVWWSSTELGEEVVRRFNLLAGFQTDPMKMTKRQELIIGLLRAEAEGDEVAFRGNLDDLAASEMLVEGETFAKEFFTEWTCNLNKEGWVRSSNKSFATLEEAKQHLLETGLSQETIELYQVQFRIIRVLTKAKVIE